MTVLSKLVPIVKRTAFRKGVTGTSSKWLGVWTLIAAAQFVRRRLGKEPTRLERYVLKPGQSLLVSDTGVTRKAFEAAGKKRK